MLYLKIHTTEIQERSFRMNKKKITLSIPEDTNKKLEELAKKHGMTKSGLVNFLINKLEKDGNIYN